LEFCKRGRFALLRRGFVGKAVISGVFAVMTHGGNYGFSTSALPLWSIEQRLFSVNYFAREDVRYKAAWSVVPFLG